MQKFRLAEGSWGIKSLGQRLMEAQSPIVKDALRSTRESIRGRVDTMSRELTKLNIPEDDQRLDLLEIIEKALLDVQHAFEARANNHPEPFRTNLNMVLLDTHREQLNIARLTEGLYEEFMERVLSIAPQWLSDEHYRATVERYIWQHGGGDINVQVANAEISLFREAYKKKVSPRGLAMTYGSECQHVSFKTSSWIQCRDPVPSTESQDSFTV